MNHTVIGVIGAGVMGSGVAQDFAQHGFRVLLLDCTKEILARARQDIHTGLRFQRLFKRSNTQEDQEEILQRITFTTDYEVLSTADFVIENVTEKWAVKQEVYQRLDALCPPKTVLAANTSAISITRLASVTRRAPRVLGMHFMNPVPLKPIVEVIRGYHTAAETLEEAGHLLARIGKQCIVVNDSPGFVSNRVLMLTINEAIFLLQEGVASAEDIDAIFKTCFEHKMGPLETADLIGLDTILFSLEVLYESFGDSKYRPCPLLRKMVEAGLYGRKSGKGFYAYN
jgi:3-hydroxybutyryl-CoA dehydrogenase